MADSMIGQGMDINSRSKAYSTTQTDYDAYVNRWEEKDKLDKLYDDKTTLSFTDMLGLMVAQFQNQTMDNQASTTDMMNQLVQMSSMQAMTEMTTNIKELTLANVMAYSASLVGQTVTLGVYDDEGKLQEIVGVVEGAGTYDGEQVIFVDGKSYLLSSIMAVGKLPPRVEEDEKPGEGEDGEGEGEGGTPPVDNEGSTGGTDGAGGTTGDDKVDQTPDAGDAGNNGGSQEPDKENDNSVG